MQDPALAQYEILISYLKILLITATRIKLNQTGASDQEQCHRFSPDIPANGRFW